MNKPAGIVSYRAEGGRGGGARGGHGRDTLLSALPSVLSPSNIHISDDNWPLKRPQPVHRLDRATSGVLLFARDKDAARSLQQAFQACTVRKGYLALVRGQPAAEFRCDYALRRGRSQRATAQERVPALTRFSRLWTGDGPLHCYSLVAARPETGRMHQIRRHLKHLSHPIIGDVKYGKGRQNRWFRAEMGLHRLALHACRLAFPDPDSEQSVVVYAPVPDDLGAPLVKFGVPPELLAKICADHSVWDAGRDINDVQ